MGTKEMKDFKGHSSELRSSSGNLPSEYTRGPWKAVTDTVHTIAGAQIADCSFAVKAVANARRIVACVNACDGISTDWLEWSTSAERKPVLNVLQSERDRLKALNEAVIGLAAGFMPESNHALFVDACRALAERP